MTGSVGHERWDELPLESLTSEAFAPFGLVLAPGACQPRFQGNKGRGWRADLHAADGGTELLVLSYEFQEWSVRLLERHFHVTQAAVALGGAASILVVAPPTARAGPNALPNPLSMRAFLVHGSEGYLLREAVWHAVDRFPVEPPAAAFVLVTDRLTTDELVEHGLQGPGLERTECVDVCTAFGRSVRVTDPGGLCESA